jgi:hypothetical protein
MKRWIAAVAVAGLLAFSGSAWAQGVHGVSEEYNDDLTHPLHLAYYLAHPIGFAAEWLVGRPIHFIISRPYLDTFFGYDSYDEDQSYYDSN